jgi:uncharacterized membrane protein (GlpM family)
VLGTGELTERGLCAITWLATNPAPGRFPLIDPFYVKLLLGFVVGGAWITLSTVAAEKFGSKIGGLVGGLPSTIVVSFFFIGWTQGALQVHDATTFMPFAFAVNIVYLVVYVLMSRRGLAAGIASALSAWFALTAVLIVLRISDLPVAIAAWLLASALGFYIMQYRLRIRSQSRVRIRYTPLQITWRAAFSGAVICFAIAMSKVGGPVWGGIFSAFPAVYTSTLVITSRSVSVEFSRSLITPLLISGVINPVVFGLALRFIILDFDLVTATVLAYAASMVSAYLTYQFIKARVA